MEESSGVWMTRLRIVVCSLGPVATAQRNNILFMIKPREFVRARNRPKVWMMDTPPP